MVGKITDATAITGANLASGDLFEVVDISDTTLAASGTNKKITRDEARLALGVRNTASHLLTTMSTSTATTPIDDTIPQVTEGVQVLSATITPLASASKIRCSGHVTLSHSNASAACVLALHINGAANASYVVDVTCPAANYSVVVPINFEFSPGSTSAQAITIRMGSSGGTMTFNGSGGARYFGGVWTSALLLEEVFQ